MNIKIAASDAEITACCPVLRELRPHVAEERFLSVIRDLEQAGYRLACLQTDEGIVAVAGFRLGENLAWDRYLYIDDLVTRSSHRSRGYGAALLAWLREYASREGCTQLHLESRLHRKDAHRFYEREGMTMNSYHFSQRLGD